MNEHECCFCQAVDGRWEDYSHVNCDSPCAGHAHMEGAGLTGKEIREQGSKVITRRMLEDLAKTLIACSIAVENPPSSWYEPFESRVAGWEQFKRVVEKAIDLAWATIPGGEENRETGQLCGMAAGWAVFGEEHFPGFPEPLRRLKKAIGEES